MQAVTQHRTGAGAWFGRAVLKTLPVLYGATIVAAYAYDVYRQLTSGTLSPGLFIIPLVIGIPFVLGWLIDRKHRGHTIALLFLVMAYSVSSGMLAAIGGPVGEFLPARYFPALESVRLVLQHTMWIPGVFIPLFFMPLYFPTGRLLSRRWRVLVLLSLFYMGWLFMTTLFRPWPWPAGGIFDERAYNGIAALEPFFDAMYTPILITFSAVWAVICTGVFLRYRSSRGVERMQLKWPLFAVLFYVCVAVLFALFPSVMELDGHYGYPITWSMAMVFPISVGIGILRYNLWDIDILLNRTLVYGSLTALIVGVYIAVAGGLGVLFQTRANALSGLVAAGIIAVLFQPVRDALQRRVNRLLYGERDDPAAVLTRVAHHLQSAETPAAILPSLVQTIARTLKIPHVAIWLPEKVGPTAPLAAWGEAPDQVQTIPLNYQQEVIGRLVVAPRGPEERFSRRERELLATIAALTATTVRAVQLSDELRRSRRRIVTAREEERRRLRRDLHDGLGPQLASQTLGLEAIDQLIPTNPQKAHELLVSLKAQAQEAILDVRRLVYDLRPPALDDLGLVGALRQSASRYEAGSLRFSFDVDEPLPTLPAAVETAAYRIALEAMTNVMRHAQATLCLIGLRCEDGHFIVTVRDNGKGLREAQQSGVGLQAMRERAGELNGQCVIQALPAGGTLVQAGLPLEAGDA